MALHKVAHITKFDAFGTLHGKGNACLAFDQTPVRIQRVA